MTYLKCDNVNASVVDAVWPELHIIPETETC